MMLRGLPNKRIATQLSISEPTVKEHISNILKKDRRQQPGRSHHAVARQTGSVAMKFFQNLQNDGISSRAQIRLLDNTFMRLVFSFTAVPFVGIPFAIWIYLLGMNSAQPLPGSWFTCYAPWRSEYGIGATNARPKKMMKTPCCAAGCRALIRWRLFTDWGSHHSI